MKANELMIGDRVRRRWTCSDTGREVVMDFQITEIRKNGETLYAWGKGGNMGRVEQLEPIPITAEILEKNEFRLIGERFVFGEIDDALVELNLSINNSYRAKISVADLMISHNGWIKYIHELQHALRLCWIEKEITI